MRKLKDEGIEIYFEKENIWTLDSKGELLITIMSSLAQEESRSISENVTWGQRKRFADGKVTIRSIFPARASSIMVLKPSRFFVFVAEMPSSVYMATNSQSSRLLM